MRSGYTKNGQSMCQVYPVLLKCFRLASVWNQRGPKIQENQRLPVVMAGHAVELTSPMDRGPASASSLCTPAPRAIFSTLDAWKLLGNMKKRTYGTSTTCRSHHKKDAFRIKSICPSIAYLIVPNVTKCLCIYRHPCFYSCAWRLIIPANELRICCSLPVISTFWLWIQWVGLVMTNSLRIWTWS